MAPRPTVSVLFVSLKASIWPCPLGACVAFASTYGVPDTFELTFDHGRSRRPCWVKWRTSDRLGVSFEKPAE